eukprot:1180181-Prorocentrum_minimum.AAC.5
MTAWIYLERARAQVVSPVALLNRAPQEEMHPAPRSIRIPPLPLERSCTKTPEQEEEGCDRSHRRLLLLCKSLREILEPIQHRTSAE